MNRAVTIIIAIVLIAGFTTGTLAKAPEGTPTRAIQDVDAKLDTYKTGPNLTEKDKEHNKELKRDVLHGTFDVNELSRLSLDKHWIPRTYPERQHFVDLMTELLENKAILSKEQGQKKAKSDQVYLVKYNGDTYLNKKKTRALTKTNVYVKSEDITVKLDYKLRKKDGEWKVYDVILDGASLVDNYKYQFDRIITKNDFNELINRMQKKLNEIINDGNTGET